MFCKCKIVTDVKSHPGILLLLLREGDSNFRTNFGIVLDEVYVGNEGGTTGQLLYSVEQIWCDVASCYLLLLRFLQGCLYGLLYLFSGRGMLLWNGDACR